MLLLEKMVEVQMKCVNDVYTMMKHATQPAETGPEGGGEGR